MMYQVYALLSLLSSRLQSDDESGQGLAEYGLILALVAVVAVAALSPLGKAIGTTLTSVTGSL